MIADMMLFARPPEPACQRMNLVEVVDTVVEELLEEAEEQGTCLVRNGISDELIVWADATQLAVALRAVCLNSLEAIGASGQTAGLIEVTVTETAELLDDDRPVARITVRDNGPGIPPDIRRHLFDPFFSGRDAGRGLGLGLSKCWRVVTAHGGRVDVASDQRQGTTLSMLVPIERTGRDRQHVDAERDETLLEES
jgi:signal transduction histidine kinase